jgi:hypothetical protein
MILFSFFLGTPTTGSTLERWFRAGLTPSGTHSGRGTREIDGGSVSYYG